jgi:hypothetical protein
LITDAQMVFDLSLVVVEMSCEVVNKEQPKQEVRNEDKRRVATRGNRRTIGNSF